MLALRHLHCDRIRVEIRVAAFFRKNNIKHVCWFLWKCGKETDLICAAAKYKAWKLCECSARHHFTEKLTGV